MTELCSIFEQVKRYVGALNAGMPSAAKGFKEGIYDTIRKVNSCGDICDKRRYPLPCCCKTFYLDCGTTLVLGYAEGFELISQPRKGSVIIDEYVSYVPNDGFEGNDEFEYRQNGVYGKVCIEVVDFEAELIVEEVNEFLQRLTIETNCASATVDWGEGIKETGLSIVIPKGVPYAPVISCGECVIELDTCIFCDSYSSQYEFNYNIVSLHDYSGESIDINKNILDSDVLVEFQEFLDNLKGDCGDPIVDLELKLS